MFTKMVGDGSLKRDFESTVAADLKSGKIDKAEYDKLIDDLGAAKKIVDQIPEDLGVKATREAFDLLTQKAKLSKMDKALVGDKVAAIDAKLMKLAGVEPETSKEGEAKRTAWADKLQLVQASKLAIAAHIVASLAIIASLAFKRG